MERYSPKLGCDLDVIDFLPKGDPSARRFYGGIFVRETLISEKFHR